MLPLYNKIRVPARGYPDFVFNLKIGAGSSRRRSRVLLDQPPPHCQAVVGVAEAPVEGLGHVVREPRLQVDRRRALAAGQLLGSRHQPPGDAPAPVLGRHVQLGHLGVRVIGG